MEDRREKRIRVFEDTRALYTGHPKLAQAVLHSQKNTRLYDENATPKPEGQGHGTCAVEVWDKKSFEAAMAWHKKAPQDRIAVLNFASAIRPGGGVQTGASAQEESLCRISTLYPCLDQKFLWDRYYAKNRQMHDPLHTDACIYTPDVVIFKSDAMDPQLLPEEQWVKVDVLSCAAPNLQRRDGETITLSWQEQYEIHLRRARHILRIAAANRVDTLILGAFGCGVFRNDPYAVATAYRDILKEESAWFHAVLFAVYGGSPDDRNLKAFSEVLGQAHAS